MNTNSSCPPNLSTHRKLAIQHLVHGRELANQLKYVLGKPSGDGRSTVVADELVMKILGSFTDTLSILIPGEADEVGQTPAGNRRKWDDLKTEDSEESSKTSVLRDRRGTYKRRKTTETWTRDTPTLADDGHAWRKYGQKLIHHAKYPRNYYRCTHRFDDPGCQATKQVQRTQDEPAMYKTTYYGHHTCGKLQKGPHIIIDSTTNPSEDDSSFLLSFSAPATGNSAPMFNKSHDHPYFPNFPHTIKQEECYRDKKLGLDHNQSSPSDYIFSSDPTTYSDHADVISSGVYSCTASTHDSDHGLDMEDLIGSVDFNDVLQFEF